MRTVYLTTTDNPYDPDTQFDEWYNWDLLYGYDCLGLVARGAKTAMDYPDETNERIREEAIDDIIRNDKLNIYKKVVVNS